MSDLVSVIIPARNEADHIVACLDSLVAQAGAPDYEIIVVDNGSTDTTPALVRDFIAAHPRAAVRLVSEPTPGRGAARAAGFAAARGHLLLSTDSDTTAPSHWVATLAAALADPATPVVTASCQVHDCSPATNYVINRFMPLFMRSYRLFMGHWWLTGSTFGITRAIYDQSGGFDPNCRDMEDIDLGWRVKRLSPITFLPPRIVTVTTAGDRFRGGIFRGLLPYVKAYAGRFWLRSGDRYARHD